MTTIGPAFDRSHVEAGCEFCGACLSVCPTGALSAKVSKWYGKPDSQTATNCGYCPMTCRLLLQTVENEVLDALPDYTSPADRGLVCVKGRFAIPEYLYNPSRLMKPAQLTPLGYDEMSWEQAISLAAEKLSGLKPDDVLLAVSPQLLNEDLFAVQQFARDVLGTENIVSSLMFDLGSDLGAFFRLAVGSSGLDAFDRATAVVSAGFDSSYGFSRLGVAAKRVTQTGGKLITLSSGESNLEMYADVALRPQPGSWAQTLEVLFGRDGAGARAKKTASRNEMDEATAVLAASERTVVVAGPELFESDERKAILQALLRAAARPGWSVVVAHPYTNLGGMLAMGALPGIGPGAAVERGDNGHVPAKVAVKPVNVRKARKVIFLVGEVPFEGLPPCDFLIYQNAYVPTDGRRPDLVLPSALFAESDGTIIGGEGRIVHLRQAAPPCGESKPDWWILSKIAEKMEVGKMRYADVSFVQAEARKHLRRFPDIKKPLTFAAVGSQDGLVKAAGRVDLKTPRYRGIPLRDVVPGMKVLEGRGQSMAESQKKEKR